MFVFGITNCDKSVAKALPRDDVLAHCLEVKEAGLVNSWLGDNASWRALMDDLGSFVTVKLFDAEEDPWWCTKEEWTEMTKDRLHTLLRKEACEENSLNHCESRNVSS